MSHLELGWVGSAGLGTCHPTHLPQPPVPGQGCASASLPVAAGGRHRWGPEAREPDGHHAGSAGSPGRGARVMSKSLHLGGRPARGLQLRTGPSDIWGSSDGEQKQK